MRVRELVVVALLVAGCSGGEDPAPSPPPPPPSTVVDSQPVATTATTGGGGGGKATPPTSSAAAASALAAAGVGCSDFSGQEVNPGEPDPKPSEAGQCTVGGVTLTITGYGSPADAQAAFTARQTLGCTFGRMGVNGQAVVVAGNQILAPVDGNVDLSNRMATALAGETRTQRCSGARGGAAPDVPTSAP